MSYIGNSPITAAFLTDTFSGNGSTTAFTMSIAPAGPTSCIVAITGVVQDPSTYSTSGTTLTFSAAPPSGTNNISVRYLGIPASGVTTTAYRTLTETTATAGQTSFSVPSYTVGFINVYRNGALLGTADYTATTGTTVVLATGATAGDLVVVESFYVSSVLNALPQTGGSLSGQLLVNGQSGQVPLIVQNNATEAMRVDASGNLGVGTSSPNGYGAGFVTVQSNGSTGGLIQASYGTTTAIAEILMTSSEGRFGTRTNHPTILKSNNTEAARIDTSGVFLINRTSYQSGITSNCKLQVLGVNGEWVSTFENPGASPSGINIKYTGAAPNNTGNEFAYFNDSSAVRFVARSNGGLANYSGNNVNLSDAREKTNVELAGSYLDKVCAIPVKTFNYVDQNLEEDDGLTLGVIAQEVQAVAPELVMESNWGTKEEPKMRLGIYQTDLQYALMKCIQEQQEIIKQLQADVAELKGAK